MVVAAQRLLADKRWLPKVLQFPRATARGSFKARLYS